MRIARTAPLWFLSTFLLFISFESNGLNIANQRWFNAFQRDDESLVIGRLVKSRQDGTWSAGGLMGLGSPYATPVQWDDRPFEYQYKAYLDGLKIGPYDPYKSEIGAQTLLFRILDVALPFSSKVKLNLFYGLNALLTALALTLITLWFFREFGCCVAIFVFVSILASQWLVVFGRNLYWSIWAIYLPLVLMMGVLQKNREFASHHAVKFGALVSGSVAIAFLFRACSYLTSTLIMMMVPFIYYSILERSKIRNFVKGMLVAISASAVTVILGLVLLCFQIGSVKGSFLDGAHYIVDRFQLRTYQDPRPAGEKTPLSYDNFPFDTAHVLKRYLGGIYFNLNNYMPPSESLIRRLLGFRYYQLIVVFAAASVLLLILEGPYFNGKRRRLSIALILTTWISILAPLSWFVIFKSHSYAHTHMNFILWQMPFTIFGFATCGLAAEKMFYQFICIWRRAVSFGAGAARSCSPPAMPRAFKVKDPDLVLSPYTGMSRHHWLDSCRFLLEGIFENVHEFDMAVVWQQEQQGVGYPKPGDPHWKFKAAEFEGLARTLMIAAHLLNEDPDLVINGYKIREYYANQILLATSPKSPRCLGTASQLSREYGLTYCQHTVEGAALCIGLMYCKSAIWDRYTQKQRDEIAHYISDFAHSPTYGDNWRYFNVIMLTFLKMNGYDIDEVQLKGHLQTLMTYYAGDGWYRDGPGFDFYNSWAFQFYGPIWCAWYGYEYEPEIAAIIDERHAELMKTYPMLFSRHGHQHMWGRSIIYRCAASAPFAAAFLLKRTTINGGLARRIASCNLLQFLGRDDVFVGGLPCLGYYGPFEPSVQSYSCSASPLWLGKIYLALALPSTSPFWTEREDGGDWEKLGDNQRTVVLRGPGLALTSHGNTGTAELRPCKVSDRSPNYNRLVFNSLFLWEDNSPGGSTAMHYSYRTDCNGEFETPMTISFNREEGGVIYRQLNLGSKYPGPARIDLADIPIPGGMIRVDRLKIHCKYEVRLGHFGLAHLDSQRPVIECFKVNGYLAVTGYVKGRGVAMLIVSGWETIETDEHVKKHPEAEVSTVIYAKKVAVDDFLGIQPFVSVMLHRSDGRQWTPKDLDVVQDIKYSYWTKKGNPFGVTVTLADGGVYEVDYGNMEGNLSF